MLKSLPVLTYQYVSLTPSPMAVNPEYFEAHMETLAREGRFGIGLEEAYAFLKEGEPLPEGSLLITFDGGFLDNFVYAYPLLKKYGHKAVLFAVTSKVENDTPPRPTIEDVWEGYVDIDGLPPVNRPYKHTNEGLRVRRDLFVSWEEARMMQRSGVFSICPLSYSHGRIFTGTSFSGLHKPSAKKSPFEPGGDDIVFGMPRFKDGPALAKRAFVPSDALLELVSSEVPQNAVEASRFFQQPGAEEGLSKKIKRLPKEEWGRMETEEEFCVRVETELAAARDIIAKEIGASPRAMAWPFGTYAPESLEIGQRLGFELFFAGTMGANRPGKSPDHIHRFHAKNRKPGWLLSRLGVYSRPLPAAVYGRMSK
jgi:peptidoglycan/xylan/chitin deacetylase (PgdA/CDA1 family)